MPAVPPPDATVAYGDDPAQVYDVRLPASGLRAPSVLLVHGGFWRAAYDRGHLAPMARRLAERGHPTAVVEYRRVGMAGGGYPGTLDDVRDVVAAVAHDPRFPAPLVAVGHSAGGHLAIWAAARPETPLAGVISIGGCVELHLVATLGLSAGAAMELIGGRPDEVPERWAVADPAQLPPPPVPVVLLHGADDDLVPAEVSRSYAAAVAGRGGRADLQILSGVGHFELIDPTDRAFGAVLAALDTFRPSTPPNQP